MPFPVKEYHTRQANVFANTSYAHTHLKKNTDGIKFWSGLLKQVTNASTMYNSYQN